MGHGPNSLMIEESIANSEPQRGYRADYVIPSPISAFRLPGGAVLPATGAGIVGYGVMETGADGIVWDDTAAATDIISLAFNTPGEFFESGLDGGTGGPPVELIVRGLIRKHDTTGSATDNADLTLDADFDWFDAADTALQSIAAVVAGTAASLVMAAGFSGFYWQEWNITQGMTAAQRNSFAGSSYCLLSLKPNETVGTALAIDLAAVDIRLRRHAALRTRSDRGSI